MEARSLSDLDQWFSIPGAYQNHPEALKDPSTGAAPQNSFFSPQRYGDIINK